MVVSRPARMLAFFFFGGASVPERLAPGLPLTFLIGQRVLQHGNQLLLIWARGIAATAPSPSRAWRRKLRSVDDLDSSAARER
jgi:hypothetical protein